MRISRKLFTAYENDSHELPRAWEKNLVACLAEVENLKESDEWNLSDALKCKDKMQWKQGIREEF